MNLTGCRISIMKHFYQQHQTYSITRLVKWITPDDIDILVTDLIPLCKLGLLRDEWSGKGMYASWDFFVTDKGLELGSKLEAK